MLASAAMVVGANLARAARAVAMPRVVQAPSGDDVVDRLRGASASLLCDALGRLGHDSRRYAMSGSGIRPMWPVSATIIGPAITTRYEATGRRGTLDEIRQHVFDLVDRAAAGSVWVTSCGTDEVLSMFGDIIVIPRSLAAEVARLRPELDRHEDETRRLVEHGGSLRASYLVGG
jgi:regulator of RNase E activity RraA